jgi:hypothetical protein
MRKLATIVVVFLITSGCGAFGSDDPLTETAQRLGEIHSGELTFRVVAASSEGGQTGFEIEGPFAIPRDGALPEAELTYTRIGAETAAPLRFIATGEQAFVEVDGQAYELGQDQVGALRGAADAGDQGPFDQLDIAAWVMRPHVSNGGKVDGVTTERVRGELDVVTAANDLLAMARSFAGAAVPNLQGEQAERLREAVDSATLEVVTGLEDRLLRRLHIAIDLGGRVPESLNGSLEGLLGVDFDLELELRDVNGAVDVDAPEGALPYEALTG